MAKQPTTVPTYVARERGAYELSTHPGFGDVRHEWLGLPADREGAFQDFNEASSSAAREIASWFGSKEAERGRRQKACQSDFGGVHSQGGESAQGYR